MSTLALCSMAGNIASDASQPAPVAVRSARSFGGAAAEASIPSPATIQIHSPGDIIAGKYQLERHLAHGGMGSVWVARHIELDTAVALKLMSPSYVPSSLDRARFLREARAAARLRSPHIIDVFDYGVDGGSPYIVMELLEGEDLCSRLERHGVISLEEAAAILTPVAKALELAHGAGIIHRDLKPSNIFLARSAGEDTEVIKVVDFGIAKELNAPHDHEITESDVLVGTLPYMSPEQAMGVRAIDHRSDVWSLGVVLFSALTGRLPFQKTELVEIVDEILNAPIPVASHIAPHLPVGVDRFFALALARKRSARFQSVTEMAKAFQRLVSTSALAQAKEGQAAQPQRGAFDILSSDFIALNIPEIEWETPCGSAVGPTTTMSALTSHRAALPSPRRRETDSGARPASARALGTAWWLFGVLIAAASALLGALVPWSTGF